MFFAVPAAGTGSDEGVPDEGIGFVDLAENSKGVVEVVGNRGVEEEGEGVVVLGW